MKSLIALLMTFGFFQLQIAKAQDVSEPCPDAQTDTEMLEGEANADLETETEVETDAQFDALEEGQIQNSDIKVKESEDKAKIEYETDQFMYEQKIDKEDGSIKSEYKLKDQGNQSDAEMESETEIEGSADIESDIESETESEFDMETESDLDADVETESDVDIESNNLNMNSDQEYVGTLESEPTVVIVEEERDRESTLENIVEAPFKAGFTLVSETAEGVGHVGKGVVKGAGTVVKGAAEGAGHIVGAPFKAIGKLFGAGDDDSDNRDS